MKINSTRELHNIAIYYSADIDQNIYREFTKELYYFLTIDTTLTASNPGKNLFLSYENDSD